MREERQKEERERDKRREQTDRKKRERERDRQTKRRKRERGSCVLYGNVNGGLFNFLLLQMLHRLITSILV
jgi:hypothetical protein